MREAPTEDGRLFDGGRDAHEGGHGLSGVPQVEPGGGDGVESGQLRHRDGSVPAGVLVGSCPVLLIVNLGQHEDDLAVERELAEVLEAPCLAGISGFPRPVVGEVAVAPLVQIDRARSGDRSVVPSLRKVRVVVQRARFGQHNIIIQDRASRYLGAAPPAARGQTSRPEQLVMCW